jgi:MYXO-CTERM domain-containing protein
MVVPVPIVLQKENVKTLPKAVFEHVDQLAAPRLVEYWEQDPCPKEREEEADFAFGGMAKREMAAAPSAAAPKEYGVKIEAQFSVGEYDVVVLSAQDSGGLDSWLRDNKYKIPEGAEPYLRPYVQSGSKFFVAKVDVKKVSFGQNGMATLSPLRFHYDTEKFNLPIRLGLINAQSAQDLLVHVLARGQRYEAANYPNAFIPTNLNVHEGVRDKFGPFYAALFDKTLEQKPKAVVTEYSWDSGTCDPCPTPPLEPNEIALLGGDVLGSKQQGEINPYGFVLTRLHARYTKDTLGEDIVFRAAPPVAGGREFLSTNNKLEEGAVASGQNNFQGRYAMRHPWTGPIECDNPRRGVWGGPPGGGEPKPRAVKDVAFVARGGVALPSIVQQDVPEIGLKSQAPANSGTHGGRADIPQTEPGARGCGSCASGGADAGLWLLAVPALSLLRRRRKPS